MTAWWKDARANPLFWRTVIIALAVITVDQATKVWVLSWLQLPERPFGHLEISGIFDLTYVENRGVSFGLFGGGGVFTRIALTLLAIGVAGFVMHWVGRLDRRVAAIGAALIVGGALGNAIDRMVHGFVVDFLDFSGLYFPWKFNVADAAINVGVAFLATDAFFFAPKAAQEHENAAPSPPPDAQMKANPDRIDAQNAPQAPEKSGSSEA